MLFQLRANDTGLTECTFSDAGPSDCSNSTARDELRFPDAPDPSSPAFSHIQSAASQLREYFAGTRTQFDIPLDPAGTPFQRDVWKATVQIPFGQTRSYWWVAVRMGNPYATRAVGGALGANPIPIIIPCHRVLRQDGSIGGFSCGLEWKRLLLDHERKEGVKV